ncbi:restriction endonuclease subunit S [Crossiella sp. CA198]|uniref:restriction endonuclease subunit S n=1 Tax=Crossiella sp. CA198 TaxID=3455607 RepID=UPI003F8D3442
MSPAKIVWLQGLSLPADWSQSKVKYVAPGMQAGEAITAESIEPVGTYPVYGGNGLRGYTEEKTHQGTRILIGRQGALCGNVHLVSGEFWASEHAIVARAADAVDPRWLAYLLRVMNLGQYSQTAAQPGIGTAQINALPVPVPPLSEQRAIAHYLDRETARIDTLIEEQQCLIEMLRERQLAAITESVVDASEKNRVPRASVWYPSLPTDWGFGRVKSIATRITDGAHISPDTDGGVFDFVSTRDLHAGSIDFSAALKTTPDTYEYMVKTGCQPHDGDVLFSKDGTVGETAVIRGEHPFVVASSLVIISPDPLRMESEYLAYVFASKTAKEQAASMMRGAGLPRLSVGNLARVEVPIPPLDEQRRIAAYLDEQTAKIDTLIAESERFVELSRERRAALITAAVTGQIDVRETA